MVRVILGRAHLKPNNNGSDYSTQAKGTYELALFVKGEWLFSGEVTVKIIFASLP